MQWKEIRKLHIEISALCNAACPQCARYPSGGFKARPTIKNSHVWTLQEVKNRLPDVSHINEVFFNGTVGDFITNPEAKEIITYFADFGCRILVNTNGSARNIKWWKELATIPNLEVRFDIDGLEDTHHLYRRQTSWAKIIENALAFIRNGGHAVWTMTIFKHNEHQVDECRKKAIELGFKEFTGRHSTRPTKPALNKEGKFDYWIESASNSKIVNRKAETIESAERKEKELPIAKPMHNTIPLPSINNCDSIRTESIYIGGDWNVSPCCFIGALSFTKLTDHRYENFLEALHSEGFTTNDLVATNDNKVENIVDMFGWIYNRVTTEKALTACAVHCQPSSPLPTSLNNRLTTKI